MIKIIIQAVFLLFIGYTSYDYGYKTAFNKQSNSYIKQLQQQELKYQELQKKFVLTQLQKENEIKAINAKHNAVISSLRNRPERTATQESSNCPPVCSRTGSTGEQLFREDAEFLIGEAAKAEVIKQSLISCRRYLLESSYD